MDDYLEDMGYDSYDDAIYEEAYQECYDDGSDHQYYDEMPENEEDWIFPTF